MRAHFDDDLAHLCRVLHPHSRGVAPTWEVASLRARLDLESQSIDGAGVGEYSLLLRSAKRTLVPGYVTHDSQPKRLGHVIYLCEQYDLASDKTTCSLNRLEFDPCGTDWKVMNGL